MRRRRGRCAHRSRRRRTRPLPQREWSRSPRRVRLTRKPGRRPGWAPQVSALVAAGATQLYYNFLRLSLGPGILMTMTAGRSGAPGAPEAGAARPPDAARRSPEQSRYARSTAVPTLAPTVLPFSPLTLSPTQPTLEKQWQKTASKARPPRAPLPPPTPSRPRAHPTRQRRPLASSPSSTRSSTSRSARPAHSR